MKKSLIWLWMLSKRLYKKPTFLLLLLLIPVLVIGYRFTADGESGVLTIGLTQQAPDALSGQIINDLQGSSELIRYQVYDTQDAAREQLEAGKVDAVWVFPVDLQSHIETFLQNPSEDNAFITVLVRRDNVTLALARERLSGVIFEETARLVYVSFLREESAELAHLSDEELLAYYDQTEISDKLFAFGEADSDSRESTGFLLSPLRGLLGVIIQIGALAAAMLYLRDEKRGLFSWVPGQRRALPELGCQLVSTVHLSVISLLSLGICGLAGPLAKELVVLLLYSLCSAVFAMMLRRLLPSMGLLATVLPVLCVVMLVICPVFFDLGFLRQLQYLLPPTYYINAIYDSAYLGYMILYTAVCGGIWYLAGKLKKA